VALYKKAVSGLEELLAPFSEKKALLIPKPQELYFFETLGHSITLHARREVFIFTLFEYQF
jgi:hypothetical protein